MLGLWVSAALLFGLPLQPLFSQQRFAENQGLPADLSLTMFYSRFQPDSPSGSLSDEYDSMRSPIDRGRLTLLGGAFIGSMVATHLYLENGWWKDNRAPFHFREDLEYGQWVDKAGHFYIAYTLGYILTESVKWANVRDEPATWIGGVGGLLMETYVEMEDGFSAWGFDRVDFAADVGGAAFHVGRYYSPFLRNFDIKASYLPSPLLNNPGGIGFKGQKHTIVDDYEGLTIWTSVKVENFLPVGMKNYWPDFLCVALGYGARDVASPNAYSVLLLAPDIDMTKVIPPSTAFLKTLGEVLNHIHFPLPAVQISPGVIWYGLYF